MNIKENKNVLINTFMQKIMMVVFVVNSIAFLGIINPAEIKADEKEYKPILVLYEEYYLEELKAGYYQKYGKEYDPKDTTFFYNPYKVMVDVNWENAYPLGYPFPSDGRPPAWITKLFCGYFTKNIIPRKEIDPENKPIYYTIDDILPKYEKCKDGLRQLEKKFGKFQIIDLETSSPDTTAAYNRALYFIFENYVPLQTYPQKEIAIESVVVIESIMDVFKSIDLAHYLVVYNDGMTGILTGSIKVPEYNELLLYPSIVTDLLTIVVNEENTIIPQQINIFDINGKVVKSLYTGLDTEQNINVSNLPNGHYFIKLGKFLGKFTVRR